jgi:small-conductance mechanosensitive channel
VSEGSDAPRAREVIDLNARMAELGFSYEPAEQMRERLVRERLQLEHQLEQEKLEKHHQREVQLQEIRHQSRIFWSIFGVVIAVGIVALWVGLFDGSTPAEARAWARTTASAIIAGVVGYFSGAGLGPKSL